MHILVIEDNHDDWYLIKEYMESFPLKYYLYNSTTLESGLDLINQIKFDVVLLDLTLPDSSGIDSVQKLLSNSSHCATIVLTGFNDKKFAIESVKYGIQDYLLKDELESEVLQRSILYSIERNALKIKETAQLKDHEIETTYSLFSLFENEKSKLSKELHDNINQLITSAILFLNIAKQDIHNKFEYLSEVDHLLKEASKEIKNISYEIAVPFALNETLDDSLNRLCNRLEKIASLRVEKSWNKTAINKFDTVLQTNIFRIFQEQFNNIAKYAKASVVSVDVHENEASIFIKIRDNGIGFDTKKAHLGLGIRNIQARVNLYKGIFQLISKPQEGVSLYLELLKNKI